MVILITYYEFLIYIPFLKEKNIYFLSHKLNYHNLIVLKCLVGYLFIFIFCPEN